MRLPKTIVLVTAASLLLGACGGGDSDETETNPVVVEGFRVLETIEIHEQDFSFDPSTIRVERIAIYGLKIVNDGEVPHSFQIGGPQLQRKIGAIQPGESTTIAVFLRKRGDYDFFCPLGGHADQGMRGVITVGPR